MARLLYTPINGQDIDLSRYAPGYENQIPGAWGKHKIPGQKGSLKDDLGDGDTTTKVKLQFVGATAPDYYTVIPALAQNRRGTLLDPRRGARQVVITAFREEVLWTERGEQTTLVDVDFESAVIGEADSFRAGPSARTQAVQAQSRTADTAALDLRLKVFGRPNLDVRALAVELQFRVEVRVILPFGFGLVGVGTLVDHAHFRVVLAPV
jgi:hypothetical protein